MKIRSKNQGMTWRHDLKDHNRHVSVKLQKQDCNSHRCASLVREIELVALAARFMDDSVKISNSWHLFFYKSYRSANSSISLGPTTRIDVNYNLAFVTS